MDIDPNKKKAPTPRLADAPVPTSKPTSLERLGGALGGAVGDMAGAAGDALSVGVGTVAKGAGNFGYGFKRGFQGNDVTADTAENPESAQVENTPPAGPPTEKAAVESFLGEGGQAAGPDVNAGSLQDIPSADVKYAGKYGDTDVLASVGVNEAGQKVTSFSDIENFDTLKGGAPAPLPGLADVPVASQSGAVPGGSGLSFASVPAASERLQQARAAAVERGDFDGALRSYMSKEERRERDERQRRDRIVDGAAKRDPLGTLEAIDRNDRETMSAVDAFESSLNKELAASSNAQDRQRAANRKAVFKDLRKEILEQGGPVNEALLIGAIEEASRTGAALSYEKLFTQVKHALTGNEQEVSSGPVDSKPKMSLDDELAVQRMNAGVS